ncbi:hypothetical protein [Chryseobacterium vrystaatense]|uniref:hypothetical protein n=1 Tax=Chryseobacterium vrystaatense TaxID=307480 RepID=UPI000A6E9717|nr:hypothetical protein [Chryseobacterium vrystaatense]
MKTLDLEILEKIEGGKGDWDAFLDGVACGYGLATSITFFGALLAYHSCGF